MAVVVSTQRGMDQAHGTPETSMERMVNTSDVCMFVCIPFDAGKTRYHHHQFPSSPERKRSHNLLSLAVWLLNY